MIQQFRAYPNEFGQVNSLALISDSRYGSNDRDEYFKRISAQPNKKLYFGIDLVGVNDTEFYHEGSYHEEHTYGHWHTSVMNGIKFRMTSSPPIYDWDRMDKVCQSYFYYNLLFVLWNDFFYALIESILWQLL